MCIKALNLDVDLIKLDMYQKYEHKKPWFVKVSDHFFVLQDYTIYAYKPLSPVR